MLHRSAVTKVLISALGLIIIVGLFVFTMGERQGAGSLTIKAGKSELVMDFSDNKLNFSELLSVLLKDEKYKSDTLSILRDSYGLYHKDSDLLIDNIRKEPGDSEFSKKMRELLFDSKGPFEQSYHRYFDVSDVRIVGKINSLGYDHKVASRFREERDHARGIFEQRGIKVKIAVRPAEDILDGYAAVCEGSSYRGTDLLLLNPNDTSKTITVFSRNSFSCIKVGNAREDEVILVQINPKDAKNLFGDIIFSSKENAILYPAPKGNTLRPMLVGT